MKLYCSAATFDNNNINTDFETTIINVNVGDTAEQVKGKILVTLGYGCMNVHTVREHFLEGLFIAGINEGEYLEIKAKPYPHSHN